MKFLKKVQNNLKSLNQTIEEFDPSDKVSDFC